MRQPTKEDFHIYIENKTIILSILILNVSANVVYYLSIYYFVNK